MTSAVLKTEVNPYSGGRYLHCIDELPVSLLEKAVLHRLTGTQDFRNGFHDWRVHKVTTLAAKLSSSVSGVRKTLRSLEELGYIQVNRRYKRGTKKFLSSEYKVTDLIVLNSSPVDQAIRPEADHVDSHELERRLSDKNSSRRNNKKKEGQCVRGTRPSSTRKTTGRLSVIRPSSTEKETIFVPPCVESSQDEILLAGCPPEAAKPIQPSKMDVIAYSQRFESIFKGKGFVHYATVNEFMERLYLEKGKDQLTAFIDYSRDLVAKTYKGSIQWNENKLRKLESMFFGSQVREEEEKPREGDSKNLSGEIFLHGPWLADATDTNGDQSKPRSSYDRW